MALLVFTNRCDDSILKDVSNKFEVETIDGGTDANFVTICGRSKDCCNDVRVKTDDSITISEDWGITESNVDDWTFMPDNCDILNWFSKFGCPTTNELFEGICCGNVNDSTLFDTDGISEMSTDLEIESAGGIEIEES